jgi:hypothetical protein
LIFLLSKYYVFSILKNTCLSVICEETGEE